METCAKSAGCTHTHHACLISVFHLREIGSWVETNYVFAPLVLSFPCKPVTMLASFALLVIVTWKAVVQPVGMSSTLLPNRGRETCSSQK